MIFQSHLHRGQPDAQVLRVGDGDASAAIEDLHIYVLCFTSVNLEPAEVATYHYLGGIEPRIFGSTKPTRNSLL